MYGGLLLLPLVPGYWGGLLARVGGGGGGGGDCVL